MAGEIIPQAVCSRYGLAVGAYSAWLVKSLMVATAFISWPISKCLDWALGRGETVGTSLPVVAKLSLDVQHPRISPSGMIERTILSGRQLYW